MHRETSSSRVPTCEFSMGEHPADSSAPLALFSLSNDGSDVRWKVPSAGASRGALSASASATASASGTAVCTTGSAANSTTCSWVSPARTSRASPEAWPSPLLGPFAHFGHCCLSHIASKQPSRSNSGVPRSRRTSPILCRGRRTLRCAAGITRPLLAVCPVVPVQDRHCRDCAAGVQTPFWLGSEWLSRRGRGTAAAAVRLDKLALELVGATVARVPPTML
mmetsp:Transcript_64287/g.139902  ORF Transcript_64287/g.139902 Transcript_64287/m.139902 type:complete len:222 (-) Transcript_64287:689-1354(-)